MDDITYTISKHCKERYAERIMCKEDTDVQRFVILNEDKIVKDINKLIEYGDIIYSGKQTTKDGRVNNINVYLNGLWIILVDSKTNNAITLYKVDLGVGDDFNNEYVSKMMFMLNEAKENSKITSLETEKTNDGYSSMINNNISQINEYKSYIKNLEELNKSYQGIIDNNVVNVKIAEMEVSSIVNKLIGKKEF